MKNEEKEIRQFRAYLEGSDLYECVEAMRCLLGVMGITISEDLYDKIPDNKKKYFILVKEKNEDN